MLVNENNTILVSSLYGLQGFVQYTIVICVTGDWLQSTTGFEVCSVSNLWIIIALYCVASGLTNKI